MLTPELVLAQRRNGELKLRRMEPAVKERTISLLRDLLAVLEAHTGRPRSEVEDAVAACLGAEKDPKLAAALRKLAEDTCDFESPTGVDPIELRREICLAATRARRLGSEHHFARDAILAGVASAQGLEVEQVEQLLFSDLKSAQALLKVERITAEALLARFERQQVQAVLLRAVRVEARVRCSTASSYRALFRQLKFRRLLHLIDRGPGGTYQITIDGPFSLFEASTRYGLELALMLPSLEACDELSLTADVRWGKQRQSLVFRHRGGGVLAGDVPSRLPDELQVLIDAVGRLGAGWKVAPSERLLELPGVGLCVPDLEFTHPAYQQAVYLELLGYWSRAAVWKRVELVEQGLGERILFAVSSRLRVSEENLDDRALGALHVFKGVLGARSILEKVEALARR